MLAAIYARYSSENGRIGGRVHRRGGHQLLGCYVGFGNCHTAMIVTVYHLMRKSKAAEANGKRLEV